MSIRFPISALVVLFVLIVRLECRADEKTALSVPADGAYAGAYIDFGSYEDDVTLEAIQKFDTLVGKQQAIIAFSSDWGRNFFPSSQLDIVAKYGAVPFIYWSPWDRPVNEPPKPNRFDLISILAGKWDGYIDMWAKGAKAFGKPMLVAWGIEMNGNWFPWSGVFYNDEEEIKRGVFRGPDVFKKAYTYVVDRVRSHGATNVLWVWHVNNTADPGDPWNTMAAYYPGPGYADWTGLSAYGIQYPTQDWVPLHWAILEHYKELVAVDPAKPILLAEWGIGEFPKKGSKAEWLGEFFNKIPAACPGIKGSVFWHERWQNKDLLYSNLRVNSSAAALDSYRKGIKSPYWLPRPAYEMAK